MTKTTDTTAPADASSPAPVTDQVMQQLLGASPPRIVFLLRRGPRYDDPATLPLQWEHARNMFSLLRAGTLLSVTALMDGTDVLGVGVLASGTRESAEALLAQDPAVRGGRVTVQFHTGASFRPEDLATAG
ncbi:MAG TPA: hypothetical protein VFQ61_12515 [Polyangiaceae bacterium]|nr:hypothetical protein [Polyangiaceae bacterium]